MSLILKQEPANTIATPPAGKSTLFVNDSSVMSVKAPDGSVQTFPTVAGSNTQVFYNNNGAIAGDANLTYIASTGTLTAKNVSVTGTLNAGDITVGSIANGTSNVDIIGVSGNVTTSVAGNANILVVTGTGANIAGTFSVSGNANVGNIGATTFVGALSGAATTAGTVTTAAQPNITSVGTLTSLGVNGTVTAVAFTANTGVFTGNGSGLSAIAGANVTGQVGNALVAGTVYTAAQPNITSVGTLTSVSVSGNANIGNIGTAGVIVSSIASGTAPFTVTSTTRVNNLNVAYANVSDYSAVTTATTGNYYLNFVNALTGNVQEYANSVFVANVANGAITATTFVGALSGAATSATTAGTVTTAAQPNITSVGTLTSLGVNGTVTAVAFTANTGVFTGNGSGLSAIAGANVTGTVASATSATSATTAGTVTTAAQPNVTSLGTLTSVSVSGNANIGNIGTAGLITATGNLNAGNIITAGVVSATGNGTFGNVSATNHTGTLVSVTGNVTGGNLVTGGIVSSTGTGDSSFAGNINMNGKWLGNIGYAVANTDAASKQYVDTMVSSGISYHQPVYVATTTTLATATGGTVTYNNGTAGVGATLTTTGTFLNIDGFSVQSVGRRILVKDEANAAWNGVYTYTSTTVITRSTDTDEYGPDSVTQLSINDYFFTQNGTVNEGVAFIVSAPTGTITFGTSNITFSTFSTSQVYDAGTGIAITGTTISANASQTQITAVGTLTSLSVSGNANIGNIGTAGILTVTGNANVGNIGATAGVFTTVTGSLTTNAQPNITSTGTLASLSVSGNANIGNIGTAGVIVSSIATGTAPFTVTSTTQVANLSVATAGSATTAGTVTTNAQPNITSTGTLASLSVSGNANIGNIGTAGVIVSSIATGTAPFTVTSTTQVANLSVATAGSATTAGTVTTAAQPNITSVGTLTSLGVNGTVTAVAFTANTGVFTGNANGISSVQAGNIVGTTLSSTVVSSSLTAVGTLASLSVTANANIGNIGTGGLITATGNITGSNIIATTNHLFSVATGVSAAGTVQGNATAITKDFNVVSTVSAGQGVVLPTAVAGMNIGVINTSANAVLVYPAVNGIINSQAANASYSLASNAKLQFVATSTTQWYTLNATFA